MIYIRYSTKDMLFSKKITPAIIPLYGCCDICSCADASSNALELDVDRECSNDESGTGTSEKVLYTLLQTADRCTQIHRLGRKNYE